VVNNRKIYKGVYTINKMVKMEIDQRDNEEDLERKRRENAISNLEYTLYQNVLGSNQVKRDPFLYGQLGLNGAEQVYNSVMFSEEIEKRRKQEYIARLKEGEAYGVFGEPSYPTNYEISLKIARLIEESKMVIPLADLERIVKGLTNGLEFNVPAELSSYTPQNLLIKSQQSELNEQEKDALNVFGILSKAYNRAVSLRVASSGYFADLNEAVKEIIEKYKPKEENSQ
jgi:6-pyruvoyl-tetrahydropterin synthase